MNMRADEFWGMSFYEFYRAIEGFADFHGGGKPKPMSRDELQDLMERYPD